MHTKYVYVTVLFVLATVLFSGCWKKEMTDEEKKEVVQQAFKEAFGELWNAKENVDKKEILVPYWASAKVSLWDDKIINLSIKQVGVSWEFTDANWFMKYTPKNKFLIITLLWENIGKSPAFIRIWTNFTVRNSEWYTYNLWTSLQATEISNEYDTSFNTCISCEFNPGEKSIEYAIFDVPERTDYQLVLDDNQFDEIYVFDLQ